jgi:hypothetical protein
MKNIHQTLKEVHDILVDADIEHALIGGLALGNLGIHRATMDVDLLVDGDARERALQALESHGYKLHLMTDEVIHLSGDIGLDLLLANRGPTRAMLKRAKVMEDFDLKALVAEDIIGLKIQAYKNNPKRELLDKADIVAIMEKNRKLDWDIIKSYADIFGEWSTIEDLRKLYDV